MKVTKLTKHFLSILLISIFILIAIGSSDNESSSSSSSDRSRSAYYYGEEFVKKRLKSPSTAKFAGNLEKKDHVTKIAENEYKIDSYVDSQNSFGATIRSYWSCTIKFVDDNVQCENLVIN